METQQPNAAKVLQHENISTLSQPHFNSVLWHRLPFDIRPAFRLTHFEELKRQEREHFRYNPKVQYWIPRNRRWYKGSYAMYQHNRDARAFLIVDPVAEPEEKIELTGLSEIDSSPNVASVAANNYGPLPPSFYAQKNKTTRPHERKQPVVFQSSSLGLRLPESYTLEQSLYTTRDKTSMVWQADSEAELLAQQLFGNTNIDELFFFEPTFNRNNLPAVGQQVTLFSGWQVDLKGWLSHCHTAMLRWFGPVSGEKFLSFDAQHSHEHDWTLTLTLPPGEYRIEISAGELIREQTVIVYGVKTAQFGVFFDGTGKNYPFDRVSTTDRFEPSNIGKLYELYPQNIGDFNGASYVRGIGMDDLEHEVQLSQPPKTNDIAKAFGIGVKDRLDIAFRELKRFLENLDLTHTEKGHYVKLDLIIDIYGYSRGAAIARIFLNELKRNQRLHLFDELIPRLAIQYRMLGLLDTVGSIGIPGIERIAGYNMNLRFGSANCVYQLTALHERRAFFPLSSIKSAPGTLTPHTFIEEPLPGVHADIGGGQMQRHEAKVTLLDQKKYSYQRSRTDLHKTHIEQKIAARLQQLQAQWAEWGGEVILKQEVKDFPVMDTVEIFCEYSLVRFIEPDLEHMALHKMVRKSRDQGVPLKPMSALVMAKLRFDLPKTLEEKVANMLQGNEPEHSWLKKNKIHISHEPFGTTGIPINVGMVERYPAHTTELGIREKFFNNPNLAET